MIDNIQIQIPSLPENIRIVESFIDNAKDQYKLNDDIYGNIMIAVTESVSNAIVHGNQSNSKKSVHLQLALEKSLIRFTVEDEGNGFDYTNLDDPTLSENLSKPGGRGIFLMKNLCDEVSFKKDGRVAELSFYLS